MALIEKLIVGVIASGIAIGSYLGISSVDRKYERLFEEGKRPIVGTVLKESYQNTLSPVPTWNGAMSYSNETVKLESKYTLKIQTDDGKIIGVSVIDSDGRYGATLVKKEALDAIISSVEEVGIDNASRISFPSGNWMHGNWFSRTRARNYPNETYFKPETQAGNKRADRIKVLPKE